MERGPPEGLGLYTPTAYRSSDHDPVVVGLSLVKELAGTERKDTLVGTPGDDRITGGLRPDQLTGNGGADVFVYGSLAEALDFINDFAPGDDRLDLSGLFSGLGYSGADPVVDGYLRVLPVGLGTSIAVDPDGPAGPAEFRPLVMLRGVTASQFVVARDILR